jgi:hypothetical protein
LKQLRQSIIGNGPRLQVYHIAGFLMGEGEVYGPY